MTGLLYCTRILSCFIALVFYLASLHSYFNLLHCTCILSCFIALIFHLALLHSCFIAFVSSTIYNLQSTLYRVLHMYPNFVHFVLSTINITLPNYPIMVWSSGSMRAHGISTNLENPNAQCRLRKVGTNPASVYFREIVRLYPSV